MKNLSVKNDEAIEKVNKRCPNCGSTSRIRTSKIHKSTGISIKKLICLCQR